MGGRATSEVSCVPLRSGATDGWLREECRLRVFDNRILRRIFEPKWDANWEWRKLHNEELQKFVLFT